MDRITSTARRWARISASEIAGSGAGLAPATPAACFSRLSVIAAMFGSLMVHTQSTPSATTGSVASQ
jgi:hypothetical protein